MRYKSQYLFLVIISCCTISVKAQKLDSLLRELDKQKIEDTIKLNTLIATGIAYQNSNPDKGIEIIDIAITLAKKLNVASKIAQSYSIKGNDYMYKDDYPEALKWHQAALELFKREGIKQGIGNAYINIGILYSQWADYFTGLEYYKNALNMYTQLNFNRGLLMALINISLTYGVLSNTSMALEYAQKALRLADSVKDSTTLAKSNIAMGEIYAKIDDHKSAINYFEKAYNIYKQINNKSGEASTLQKLGGEFHDIYNFSKAIEYQTKSLEISNQAGFKQTSIYGLILIGDNYMDMHDFGNALKYYIKGSSIETAGENKRLESILKLKMGSCLIFAPDSILDENNIPISERYPRSFDLISQTLKTGKEISNLDLQRDSYKALAELDSAKNDHINAFEQYKNYIIIRDSILNDKKRREIQRLTMQYEFDHKADSMGHQKQITDEKLEQQILLARQQQQKLILNEKELELSNKEKDLQKLAYLKTHADLQNEQLEKKGKQKQLIFSEKENQLQQAKVKTLTQEKKLIAFKQQQQWIYIIGGLILLGFAGFYYYYRTRLHEGRLKNELAAERLEQQQKEADFQRQLGDISLSALRSQMNPHFIFNCLNSIKLYTTQNDTAAASEYLTKFSRLIRLVLENSRNDRISLAAEFDALRLYMEMKAMRLRKK